MKTNEIYKMIEDKVIEQLKNGIIPWRRCYHVNSGDMCISHQTGNPYSLLNQMMLDIPGEYWSFAQIQKEGYRVRKGAKSSKIVFWKTLCYKEESKCTALDGSALEVTRQIPFLKYYNVFHESDIEGLPTKTKDAAFWDEENKEPIEKAEEIISKYLSRNEGLQMVTADRTPCFDPSTNTIYVPDKCQFDLIEDFYSTCFHEMTHSTQEALGRPKLSSDEDRAREELVAEIGAAFLCGKAGIDCDKVITNQQAYCSGWLKALSGRIKWLIWASSRAEAAYKHIIGETNPSSSENED